MNKVEVYYRWYDPDANSTVVQHKTVERSDARAWAEAASRGGFRLDPVNFIPAAAIVRLDVYDN